MKNNASAIKIEHLSSNEVQVVRLDDERLFSIGTGGTPNTSEPQYWNGDIPWVTPTDLSNLGTAVITETARTITPEGAANSSAKPLPVGSVVISTRAPIGYATILGQEMAINQGCKAVVIKDPTQVSSEYLYYNVLTQTQKMQELGSGSTFRELSQHNLKSLEIPIPPKKEQEKIAHILNTIKEVIKIQNELIEKTKELKAALIQKLFTEGEKGEKLKDSEIGKISEGWEIKKLSSLCDLLNGYAFESNDYIQHSNTLNIRMSNIRPDSGFDPDYNPRYLPDSYTEKYKGFLLQEGDLIIAMTDMAGDPKILGVPTIVSKANGRKMLLNQRVGKLYGFDTRIINSDFLKYYLVSEKVREFYRSLGKRGIQINLSKNDILSVNVPIPTDKSEQLEIVNILSTVDKKIELEQRKKVLYQELFEAMLDKLMLGEIRVDEVNFN